MAKKDESTAKTQKVVMLSVKFKWGCWLCSRRNLVKTNLSPYMRKAVVTKQIKMFQGR